jgi:hypothetical protein
LLGVLNIEEIADFEVSFILNFNEINTLAFILVVYITVQPFGGKG